MDTGELAPGRTQLATIIIIWFFRAIPTSYGDSQARGLIGAVTDDLRHNHSNAGLLIHWTSPGIEPASSRMLVRFVNHRATTWTLAGNYWYGSVHIRILWHNRIGDISAEPGCKFNPWLHTVGWRVQHCHSCSSDSIPGLGTSIYPGCSHLKKKKKWFCIRKLKNLWKRYTFNFLFFFFFGLLSF